MLAFLPLIVAATPVVQPQPHPAAQHFWITPCPKDWCAFDRKQMRRVLHLSDIA